MKLTARLLAILAFALILAPAGAEAAQHSLQTSPRSSPQFSPQSSPMSVIEMFTSQGCSSCPPADKLLARYAARDDILALTYHVDYWDYLGWKDTLATPANSERQRAYGKAHGSRSVYTPQAIVNGLVPADGYDGEAIEAALVKSRAKLGARIPVSIAVKGGTLHVAAPAGAQPEDGIATVWLVLFSTRETVTIERGENAGSTATYYNVVREMMPIGTWDGTPTRIDLPRSDVMSRGHRGCAVFLQAGTAGPILGAARLKRW